MKRFLTIALAAATGLVIAGSASAAVQEGTYFAISSTGTSNVAAYSYGMSANGIQASRHNLGAMSNMFNTAGTSEVCVFCHTPHHTLTSTTPGHPSYAPAPIWNRQGNTAANYIGYGTTIGGSNITATQYGGVTLACLSCHDGVTTFDNIVNAPGSGLGANGFTYGAGHKQGWTEYDGTDLQGGTQPGGSMPTDITDNDIRLNIGAGANGNNATANNVDMSNDHPMSVCYSDSNQSGDGCNPGDTVKRASLRDRSTVIGDIDLSTGLATTNGALGVMGAAKAAELINNVGQNRWAVRGFISGGAADGAGANGAKISDLLRLGKVECSSCHDPHFKNRSNIDFTDATTDGGAGAGNTVSDDVDGLFLRRVGGNAGSGVCRTCHNK